MQKIIIQKGDSARIAIVLPADKMADVQDIICYVGRNLVFKKSDDTLTATADPNIFHLDLKSDQTNTLAGETELAVAVDYSDLGVKKTATRSNLVIQVDKNVNDFHNDSISDLVLATITVTINETTISASSCVVAYAKGENGDIGPQGPIGLTGPQGATGPIGPQGPQGKSNVIYKRISAFPATPITGTTARTPISIIPLASLGLTVGSFFDFKEYVERTVKVGTGVYNLWLHDSNDITIGTPVQIGTFTITANTGFIPFRRHYSVQSGNLLRGYSFVTSAINDSAVTTAIFSSTSLAGKTHIISTITPANSGDTAKSLDVLMLGEA